MKSVDPYQHVGSLNEWGNQYTPFCCLNIRTTSDDQHQDQRAHLNWPDLDISINRLQWLYIELSSAKYVFYSGSKINNSKLQISSTTISSSTNLCLIWIFSDFFSQCWSGGWVCCQRMCGVWTGLAEGCCCCWVILFTQNTSTDITAQRHKLYTHVISNICYMNCT